jgi:hypothetical protein
VSGGKSRFFSLLPKEGWREAPGWFDELDTTLVAVLPLPKEGWREAPAWSSWLRKLLAFNT